jgi:hypothetical protein
MIDGATTLERLSDLEDIAARRDPKRDPLGWARAEAALCQALAEEGASEDRLDWLVEAALRAADAVTARPLPIELREALLASMHRALRTLAQVDGRGRRRLRPAARSCA